MSVKVCLCLQFKPIYFTPSSQLPLVFSPAGFNRITLNSGQTLQPFLPEKLQKSSLFASQLFRTPAGSALTLNALKTSKRDIKPKENTAVRRPSGSASLPVQVSVGCVCGESVAGVALPQLLVNAAI